MPQVVVTRAIKAAPGVVFRAVSDISNLPETNPDILGVEFLSEQRSGVGTRFRETRRMGKKQATTDLEVTEYDPERHVRIVADSHGTVWDTVFTVTPSGERTTLELAMDARGHKFMAKLMNVVFQGMFKSGLEKHVDAVQAYCEQA